MKPSNLIEIIENNCSSVDFTKPVSVRDCLAKVPYNVLIDALGEDVIKRTYVALVGRQLSAQTAKTTVGTAECSSVIKEVLEALSAGYVTKKELENSRKVETKTVSGSKKLPFGWLEIIAQARSMTPTKDKETLSKLDTLITYTDEQYGLVLASIADKPDSLLSRAIAELSEAANKKAEEERAKLLETIIVV